MTHEHIFGFNNSQIRGDCYLKQQLRPKVTQFYHVKFTKYWHLSTYNLYAPT